jgi:integrase
LQPSPWESGVLIPAHAAHLRLASYRPSSVKARVAVLTAFERGLDPHHTLATAERLHVEAFLGRDLAPESRRAYRSHLRGFYTWATDEGHVAVDPTLKLPTVRVPRGVPRPITEEQLRKAVIYADARMRAWLLLMCLAGLRCMEVAGLRPEDLSETENGPLLFLRECKGGGTGVVPAHPGVVAALRHVPIRNGVWWTLSPHSISTAISTHLRSLGINATAHQLRHSAGTEWYRVSGHDLLTTARLLRHATVQTTQVYAKVEHTRPAEVVRAMWGHTPEAQHLTGAAG